MIIYFERHVQEELLRRFHAALVPGGFLVLGTVETPAGPSRAPFQPVSARDRVYRRSA